MHDTSFHQPHEQLRQHVASGAPVYLPVNPFEFHGPHLPLANDAIVSAGLIRDLHQRLQQHYPDWPLVVAPDLGVGTNAVAGPGTRPVSFELLKETICEACQSLATLGAKRVILMTFHGDLLHNLALEEGARFLRQRGIWALAPTHSLLRELLAPSPGRFPEILAEIPDPAERAAMEARLGTDLHAGFAETSLTLHYCPEGVSPSYRNLPPCPDFKPVRGLTVAASAAHALGQTELAQELSFAARGLGWYTVEPFLGYTGRPHLATPRVGALLARQIVDMFAQVALRAIDDPSHLPRPVMRWLAQLPFGDAVAKRRRRKLNRA